MDINPTSDLFNSLYYSVPQPSIRARTQIFEGRLGVTGRPGLVKSIPWSIFAPFQESAPISSALLSRKDWVTLTGTGTATGSRGHFDLLKVHPISQDMKQQPSEHM